jgi:EpsI family protein
MSRPWPLRVVLAAAAVMVAIGAAATVPPPARKVADFRLDTMVPKQFDDWRVDPSIVPVSLAPDVQAQLDTLYEQVLARAYVNSRGQRVMLSIAYGGDQRDALRSHRQEVCYRAQGFTVQGLSVEETDINGRRIPMSRFQARRSGRIEPVTYWMTMGTDVIVNRTDRLVAQVREGIVAGAVPDGMVVRVSSVDPDLPHAYGQHVAFMDALLGAMPADAARRLTGR